MTDTTHRIVLVTARDPLRAGDGAYPLDAATELAGQGHTVTLVLLEDAAALARSGHAYVRQVETARAKGVRIIAEDEALARRAILPGDAGAVDGVEPASIGEVLELLMNGSDRQAWL